MLLTSFSKLTEWKWHRTSSLRVLHVDSRDDAKENKKKLGIDT